MANFVKPQKVLEALKILTTASEKLEKDTTLERVFENLLATNIIKFDQILESNSFEELGQYWDKDTTVVISPDSSPRWRFVLYCLKSLHILQQSLTSSVAEFQQSIPPNSSKMSPDTLSFNEQKVVKGTVQFIIGLGVCPSLQKGVGVPLHLRSGYSELVKMSERDNSLFQDERNRQLFMCIKTLLSCVQCPALGTLILTQHLVDILAALFQMKHIGKLSKSPNKATDAVQLPYTNTACSDDTGIQDHKVTEVSSVMTENSDCLLAENDKFKDNFQHMNPATVVDYVRSKVRSEHYRSCESGVGISKDCDREPGTREPSHVYQSAGLSEEDFIFCENCLQDLLAKIYPPLLVRTLLLLQGAPNSKKQCTNAVVLQPAPKWLRLECGQQLTAVMMRPKGVQSVLRGMLDEPGAGQGMTEAADWRKCDAVAKVICCCPLQSLSVEEYYRKVAPQILDLLHIPDKQVCRQFLRVACSTISNMATQQPKLAKDYIITPLIKPLIFCSENTGLSTSDSLVVDEEELTRCVEDCHKVFVCGSADNVTLVTCLQPVILVLYELYVFTKPGIAAIKTACQEILVTFLKHVEPDVALTCLQLMTFQKMTSAEFPRMHQNFKFVNGTHGSIAVTMAINDSSDAGYQEQNVDCIVSLMTELKETSVPGQYLVYMLKELTQFIEAEVAGDSSDLAQQASTRSDGGQALLDIEQQYHSRLDQFYRKLTLLNVLAAVCEALGPDCINNAKHTLDFVKATLERGVQVCKATEDMMMAAFENETLTMAMGLLTALLTGAFKLTEEDRSYMQELLPLLQEIGLYHPESSVQEMATDIRIAIATHGAVWSEVSKNRSKNFEDISKKINQEKVKASQSKLKPVVKIEEIQDGRHSADAVDRSQTCKDLGFQHNVNTGQNATSATNSYISECVKNKHTGQTPSSATVSHVPDYAEDVSSSGSDNAVNKSIVSERHLKETVSTSDKTSVPHGHSEKNESNSGKTSVHVGHLKETVSNSGKTSGEDTGMEKSVENENKSELDKVFEELCDPLIPVRGHGLIRLNRLVQKREPEMRERQAAILKIFEENLDHGDSYIYLSAVNGLASLCDWNPCLVLPRVCEQFSGHRDDQRAGKGQKSPELRMKLGEVMVKASRSLGETIPQYRDLLLSSVLVGVRDTEPLVRASSLSNLGDICKLLRFSLGNYVHEVFECCSSTLKHDRDVQVRRAAAQAVTLLLQGLGEQVFKILDSVMKDLYRLLKHVMLTEKDDGVKLHIHLALNELDDITRGQLFPKQKLEKKIQVLNYE